MKSIDTYLCKEKKEVYKINTNIIIPQANRLYTMQEVHDRMQAATESESSCPKLSDGYWPLRLIFVSVMGWVIYKGLSH